MTKKSLMPIILMILVWAGYYIASKYLVNLTGSPYLTGMLLRGAALIIYTAILLINGDFKLLFKTGKVWYLLLIIGVLGFALDTFANIGFKYSSASSGTVLLKLDVLMVNIVTAIFIHKSLKVSDWIFSIIMLIGVILVLNINYKTLNFNIYDLFFILSAMAITANAFIIKWVQKKFNVNSNVIGYYNNLTVFILFTISCLITGDLTNWDFGSTNSIFWIVAISGGLMQCAIYIFYYYNLKRFQVWLVKVFLLFVPIVTSIVSIIFLKERLQAVTLIGMGVVLIGAFGILITKSKDKGEVVK